LLLPISFKFFSALESQTERIFVEMEPLLIAVIERPQADLVAHIFFEELKAARLEEIRPESSSEIGISGAYYSSSCINEPQHAVLQQKFLRHSTSMTACLSRLFPINPYNS